MWKQKIKNETINMELDIEPKTNKLFYLATKTNSSASKILYWKLIDEKFPTSKGVIPLWEKELNIEIDADEFWNIYPNFRKHVKPTKLQYLQYRILNFALTTNLRRSKWNKEFSPLCTFCNTYVETVSHLILECVHTKELWRLLGKMINYYFHTPLELDKTTILLNNYGAKSKEIINFLLIVMKHYIYASKCFVEIPTFTGYMSKISHWYLIDKQIAFERNKLKTFHKKWKNLF